MDKVFKGAGLSLPPDAEESYSGRHTPEGPSGVDW